MVDLGGYFKSAVAAWHIAPAELARAKYQFVVAPGSGVARPPPTVIVAKKPAMSPANRYGSRLAGPRLQATVGATEGVPTGATSATAVVRSTLPS